MQTISRTAPTSTGRLWTGRAMSALVVLFLLFDSVIKLLDLAVVQESMAQLGYPVNLDRMIGLIEFICLLLYAIPRTSVLGAILLTGLLGGAISTHVRVGDPLFSHVLFGVYLGPLAWGGLYLRNERLRGVVGFDSSGSS